MRCRARVGGDTHPLRPRAALMRHRSELPPARARLPCSNLRLAIERRDARHRYTPPLTADALYESRGGRGRPFCFRRRSCDSGGSALAAATGDRQHQRATLALEGLQELSIGMSRHRPALEETVASGASSATVKRLVLGATFSPTVPMLPPPARLSRGPGACRNARSRSAKILAKVPPAPSVSARSPLWGQARSVRARCRDRASPR